MAPTLLDPEVIQLVRRLNELPGIKTTESCCGHGSRPFSIFFQVDPREERGLFFLTRCADRRYWKYGYLWQITLSVGDAMASHKGRKILPIAYELHSGPIVGFDAYAQAQSLVENIDTHWEDRAFREAFNLDFEPQALPHDVHELLHEYSFNAARVEAERRRR